MLSAVGTTAVRSEIAAAAAALRKWGTQTVSTGLGIAILDVYHNSLTGSARAWLAQSKHSFFVSGQPRRSRAGEARREERASFGSSVLVGTLRARAAVGNAGA